VCSQTGAARHGFTDGLGLTTQSPEGMSSGDQSERRQCTPCVSTVTCLATAIRQHTSAYVSMRQHASAYVSIRQLASAYVSMREDTQWRAWVWSVTGNKGGRLTWIPRDAAYAVNPNVLPPRMPHTSDSRTAPLTRLLSLTHRTSIYRH
jgi:hypothetical protein